MLATELSRLPAPDTVAQDSALSWKQVVASAEPFLHAVATQLGDQIQKFDPEIAGYAEYAHYKCSGNWRSTKNADGNQGVESKEGHDCNAAQT